MPNWLTLSLTAILSAAPGLLSFIPAPYSGIASGVIALTGSIYHLFQESPAQSGGKLHG